MKKVKFFFINLLRRIRGWEEAPCSCEGAPDFDPDDFEF